MRHAAFLRAVNVAGQGKLPMAELRALCSGLGFTSVRTYIQSGNVVFDGEGPVRAALERALRAHMGRPVGVVLRTGTELEVLLAAMPFPEAAPNRVGVMLFNEELGELSAADQFLAGQTDEEVVPGPRALFIHFPSGMGRSKLRIPGAAHGTMRNLNTLRKVANMVAGP
ncbi:MAG: DUF1697 domain-containing protein [Pseudomonadota bacterium]